MPRAAARGGVRDVRVSRIPTLVTGGMADEEGMGGADGAPSEGVTVGVAKGGWEGGNVRRRRVPGPRIFRYFWVQASFFVFP